MVLTWSLNHHPWLKCFHAQRIALQHLQRNQLLISNFPSFVYTDHLRDEPPRNSTYIFHGQIPLSLSLCI
ncbi:hypothetical protein GIB67_042104 [Kingdonia uniflora]|uniref:Uncharacterized protein n=1 Tax=Kingdonia uniflora TaxID=39325 RepID=A0A7J7L792_9MAGN|nr:hypothetical protein GIB67_042104 [Kingdonia uniflora]